MAKLAILGHATRGKEVIELLEMLGGKNDNHCCGLFINRIYFINEYGYIESCDKMHHLDYLQLTLEEFFKKFPYRVGDKVKNARINDFIGKIVNVRWDNYEEEVIYHVEWDDETKSKLSYFAKGLQPYNEESMEGKITMNEDKGTLVEIDLTREFKKANEIEVILGDYEFILKDGKTYFVKKNKYPKTYEECCDVLNICPNGDIVYAGNWVYGGKYLEKHLERIRNFQKLKICRDAYWKIAGEEMGFIPWEPDWKKPDERKYCITNTEGNIAKWVQKTTNKILAFPTEEMQDAFYENFKTLIEQCKEFL